MYSLIIGINKIDRDTLLDVLVKVERFDIICVH